jgi:hypothetical protein
VPDVEDKIGNPLFAIETNLDPLERRVREGRVDEALGIISEIRSSLEKAKQALRAIASQ